MKKLFVAAFALMISFSMFAQNNQNNNVPDNIRTSFGNTYQGASNVTWEAVTLPVFAQYSRSDFKSVQWYPQMQGYRASYIANNRLMQVYYTEGGKTYTVAGPVIESWVPDDVITKVITQYGSNIYDVTMMKNSMDSDVYQVRFKENNNLSTAWINADGSQATAADIFVSR
jgi:hypothetical protein